MPSAYLTTVAPTVNHFVDERAARRPIHDTEHDIDISESGHNNIIMSTSSAAKYTCANDSDVWPSFFAHPRVFHRETENRPYLDYVDNVHSANYQSDSEDKSSEDASDTGSEINSDGDMLEEEDQGLGDGSDFADGRSIEWLSPVRRFNRAATVRAECTFWAGSDPLKRFPTFGDALGDDDVHTMEDRRYIYVPDLDAPEMETLASTATLSQRDAVLSLLHHHVNLRPFVGVHIPSNGFRPFNLHMHLPYFALRKHQRLHRDQRIRPNGSPLRGSWTVKCMDKTPLGNERGTSAGFQLCLYEAQASVTIVGVEERIWAAIGTRDTFFEPNDSTHSVKYHHERRRTSKDTQDPISGRVYPRRGARNMGLSSFADPRKYFLTVLEEHLGEILIREYENIAKEMQEAVGEDGVLGSTRRQLQNIHRRNDAVLEHLPKIVDRLSTTLNVLEGFKDKGMKFFTEKSQRRYLNIDLCHEDLIHIKEKIQRLEATARAKNQAIKAKFELDGHRATVRVQVLAVVATAFMPLSYVIQIFGAEKFPFTFNATLFVFLLLLVIFLHAVAYWLILNWSDTVKPVAVAYGNRVGPLFNLFAIMARIQEAVNAAVHVLARRPEPSELAGSQPEELPGQQPIQLPAPSTSPSTATPSRRFPWPKPSQRNEPGQYQLNDIV
ncbi:hypothetical protein QBC34DRAFT_499893 [Podospora aff. communis PSN243]|uniref:Uncharacterized protein n=1 Tax=Podospora aff. communis PSN243 TaxID=3040156 RepID=A0AAV9FXT4_9PEZI|nr:hypothetical protein QBC34DRAFT_499893 [Podospora aff. communis PSN243]